MLPFHDLLAGFEMDSEDCALTVTYSSMDHVKRHILLEKAAVFLYDIFREEIIC